MEFTLEKRAKGLGGDRYVCVDNDKFTIYVPQSLSRQDNKPHPKLTVDIRPATNES